MKVTKLESFPAGSNPFRHDAFHMGAPVNGDIMVMHPNDHEGVTPYIIVVNCKTGERVQVEFAEDASDTLNLAKMVNTINGL